MCGEMGVSWGPVVCDVRCVCLDGEAVWDRVCRVQAVGWEEVGGAPTVTPGKGLLQTRLTEQPLFSPSLVSSRTLFSSWEGLGKERQKRKRQRARNPGV